MWEYFRDLDILRKSYENDWQLKHASESTWNSTIDWIRSIFDVEINRHVEHKALSVEIRMICEKWWRELMMIYFCELLPLMEIFKAIDSVDLIKVLVCIGRNDWHFSQSTCTILTDKTAVQKPITAKTFCWFLTFALWKFHPFHKAF